MRNSSDSLSQALAKYMFLHSENKTWNEYRAQKSSRLGNSVTDKTLCALNDSMLGDPTFDPASDDSSDEEDSVELHNKQYDKCMPQCTFSQRGVRPNALLPVSLWFIPGGLGHWMYFVSMQGDPVSLGHMSMQGRHKSKYM